MEGKVTRKVYFETLLPAAFCFVGGVVLGNFAYTFITVGYIQMIKAITPVPLFLLYVIRGREHPSFLQLAILATISGGVMIASVGELQFSWIGCIIQVAAVCCDCLRVVTTDSFIKDSKIDSLSVLYYIAPTSCVAVTVGWYLWEAKNIPWSVFTPTFSLILLANGLLAFALNFAALFAMKTSSGMIMSICGPVKDFIVIISSSWMFGAPVTWLQWFGFGISITGIFLYQQYKQDPVVLTEKVDQFCLRPLLTVIRTVVPSETRVEKDAEREGLVMSFQELNKNDEDMRENDA
jgi:drug/metabolite transporter (DMT)-like permease